MKILLTGDDGYASYGTRVLIHHLKKSHELAIVGTKGQQSGVGGHISMKQSVPYGETVVDGVPAYWVDGYPVDALESSVGFFKEPYDLVISGINWGANVGNGTPSGTVSAALRSLNIQIAPKAIMLSWHLPSSHWTYQSKEKDDISKYLDYPGNTVAKVIALAIQKDYWGADVLNINFPSEKSSTIRFVKPLGDMKLFYAYPVVRNEDEHTFRYRLETLMDTQSDITSDSGAMLAGYISVSPWNKSMLNESVYNKMKDQEISI